MCVLGIVGIVDGVGPGAGVGRVVLGGRADRWGRRRGGGHLGNDSARADLPFERLAEVHHPALSDVDPGVNSNRDPRLVPGLEQRT